MTRVRSPGYPSVSLGQAIEVAGKIYAANRTNPIDREAAVRDMGYSGMTGASGKMLANLLHFGLLEKSGKGGVRVSTLTVDILHPDGDAARKSALAGAAFSPSLFAELRQKFPDGVASENAIRSHLMREGFADVAVGPAISSFLETCRYIEQEGAFKSHIPPVRSDLDSDPKQVDQGGKDMQAEQRGRMPPSPPQKRDENVYGVVPQGSRVVFSEEGAPGESLQVIAQGEVSDGLLEALEDFVKRQRKRLAKAVS